VNRQERTVQDEDACVQHRVRCDHDLSLPRIRINCQKRYPRPPLKSRIVALKASMVALKKTRLYDSRDCGEV
jgi:hypothetical protein